MKKTSIRPVVVVVTLALSSRQVRGVLGAECSGPTPPGGVHPDFLLLSLLGV